MPADPPTSASSESIGITAFIRGEVAVLFSSSSQILAQMSTKAATPYRGSDVRPFEVDAATADRAVRTRRITAAIYVLFTVALPLGAAARLVSVLWDQEIATSPVTILLLLGASLLFAAPLAFAGLFVAARLITWLLVRRAH